MASVAVQRARDACAVMNSVRVRRSNSPKKSRFEVNNRMSDELPESSGIRSSQNRLRLLPPKTRLCDRISAKKCFSGFSIFPSKRTPSAQLYFGLDDSIFPEKQNICGGESGRIGRGMESVKEAQLYSANGLSFIHPLPLSHAHSALTIERAGSRRRRRESSSAASTASPSSKDSRKGTSFIQ